MVIVEVAIVFCFHWLTCTFVSDILQIFAIQAIILSHYIGYIPMVSNPQLSETIPHKSSIFKSIFYL